MKNAICASCSTNMQELIPDDAGPVVCFACDNATIDPETAALDRVCGVLLNDGRALEEVLSADECLKIVKAARL